MKNLHALAFGLLLSLPAAASFAAPGKTYQVTGPVLELRDDAVVVKKGAEKWEIARGADTKVKGALKVGPKVTIEYRMTAPSIESKAAAGAKGPAAEAPAKAAPAAAAPAA